MIDLTSKDCTYTTLKVNQIKRELKEIKPEIKDLSPLEVINIALIIFSYLCEGDCLESVENNLILTYAHDVLLIDVENLTMQLKFKNKLLNDFLSIVDKAGYDNMMKDFETLKELVGDDL